jgi:hypothetical protein
MQEQFASWQIISAEFRDFDAPGNLRKSFITLIAQKP